MNAPILRIGIDARLIGGASGGLEQVIIGLAYGLARLDGDTERYHFLTLPGEDAWLRPYLSGPCDISTPSTRRPFWHSSRSQVFQALPGVGQLLARSNRSWALFVESLGIEVVHATIQKSFFTRARRIYHPHDLQHRHLRNLFSWRERIGRDLIYRSHCRSSDYIAVTSHWGKNDLQRQYGVPNNKVMVVNWAPVNEAYQAPRQDDIDGALRSFDLTRGYLLYPAQPWPHKNHVRLFHALAILKERYEYVPMLVCTGRKNKNFDRVAQQALAFGVEKQVRFLDFVSAEHLQCLYFAAKAVVVPTKFEAASGPVWEAFLAGTPVACSNATSLPDQAGDGALIFDPESSEEIATAIWRIVSDDRFSHELAERGKARIKELSWDRTARTFRAYYRHLANRPLSDEDCTLLEAPSVF